MYDYSIDYLLKRRLLYFLTQKLPVKEKRLVFFFLQSVSRSIQRSYFSTRWYYHSKIQKKKIKVNKQYMYMLGYFYIYTCECTRKYFSGQCPSKRLWQPKQKYSHRGTSQTHQHNWLTADSVRKRTPRYSYMMMITIFAVTRTFILSTHKKVLFYLIQIEPWQTPM